MKRSPQSGDPAADGLGHNPGGRPAPSGNPGAGAPANGFVKERQRSRPAVAYERKPGPVPKPGKTQGPITLTPAAGQLPDTAEELLAVIEAPANVAQAIGAVKKLGELYNRDITDDMSVPDLQDFNPMVTAIGIGGNPEAIKSFVLYAMPLRRALARCFQARTADVSMMIDLATMCYWKVLQAERASVIYLTAAIERPHLVDRVTSLERVKDLACRQLLRLLENLRLATGRRLTLDPDADAARLLRFPAELVDARPRRAARG